jgi:protein O-GlcNAc transferase
MTMPIDKHDRPKRKLRPVASPLKSGRSAAAADARRPGKTAVRKRPAASKKRSVSSQDSESWLRFGIASILRLSDRLTGRLVSSYDDAFDLDEGSRAEIYLEIGANFLREKNYENAVSAFRKALKIHPEDGVVWTQIGAAYLGQGAPRAAVKAYHKALKLGTDDFDVHFQLAEALAELDDYQGSVEELRLAIQHTGDDAEAYYRLGVALDRLERYPEAVAAFEKATELAPREVSYYQSLGFCYDSIGEHQKAVNCLKRAVELERRATR